MPFGAYCISLVSNSLQTHWTNTRQSTKPNFLNSADENYIKLNENEKEFTGCVKVKFLHSEETDIESV